MVKGLNKMTTSPFLVIIYRISMKIPFRVSLLMECNFKLWNRQENNLITGFHLFNRFNPQTTKNLQISQDQPLFPGTSQLPFIINPSSSPFYCNTFPTLLYNFQINQKKAPPMNFSFFNFSAMDLAQYDAMDLDMILGSRNMPTMSTKDPNYIQTESNDGVILPNSRSMKTCMDPFESSFQCDFSYQHNEALNKKSQNFMEAISSCSQKIQIQELRSRILQGESGYISSCDEMIDSEYCDIEENEKTKFKVDLRFEKKFKEYLDQITKKFIPEVAGQLLSISNYVWLQYTKVMDKRFTQSELISWAKNLADSKFKEYRRMLQKTKEVCFREDEEEVFPNFEEAVKGFMNYYFVTIVLCVEQFFENPFFQEEKEESNPFKRGCSDDDCYSFDQFSELQEDIYGCKKLKF